MKKKEIITDEELVKISSSKVTIIFASDLSKFDKNLLKQLKLSFKFPVEILNKENINIAEEQVRSSKAPHLFIADSNIYFNPKYSFGDVEIIVVGEELSNQLETSQEKKIEILSKK